MAEVGIVYYSQYGNTFELAQRIAEGVEKDGGRAHLRRVPETLPEEIIEQTGMRGALERQADVTEAAVDELAEFDGIVFGSPTRYGNRTAQMSAFLDRTGPLWAQGRLIGKPAGFFTGASTMHGGFESTILTMSTFAFHMGMVIVPAGYAFSHVGSTRTGGSPYGPSAWNPQQGKDGLSDDEIEIALQYGRHFNAIADRLRG